MSTQSPLSLPSSSPDIDLIPHAESLCDAGLYLQVQPLLPALLEHDMLRGRLIAARAQSHLGARRSADAYITRCWRNNPRFLR